MSGSLTERALRVRERILKIGAGEHGTHVGGSLSAADLLTVLYGEVLRTDPRDWFVLSKGHASAALYAVFAEYGLIPEAECDTYGAPGSRLAGHPLRRLGGVDFPTGSLGHGLSLATGVALAAKRGGRLGRAFVLMGDGELQEGSVWEAAMVAAQLRLDNLIAVVDRNRWQISGRTEDCVGLEPLPDRWRAFGWSVREVDGHDLDALPGVLGAPPPADRPTVVIANTVKGSGVPIFEDRKKSHYVKLSPQLYARASAGLRNRARRSR
ncbi:transketolase [Nonomuraea fuscirosea]|uniref:transketolase n=1 Tax=Nonomuraea fuscirosea TaxID=1291556 RepID=UPI00341C6D21